MGFFYLVGQRHEAVWICSALIALTAIFFALKYRRGVARMRGQILALIKILDGVPADAARHEVLAAAGNSAIGDTPLFIAFETWSKTFVKNLAESGPRYYSTAPAEQGMDLDGVASSAINFRLIHAIPNVLIGMGLLFTFLGLTAAPPQRRRRRWHDLARI